LPRLAAERAPPQPPARPARLPPGYSDPSLAGAAHAVAAPPPGEPPHLVAARLAAAAAAGAVGAAGAAAPKPSSGAAREPVVVVGAGPGGLFAALAAAEAGLPVVLLERGQGVEQRGRDIGALFVRRVLNPDSNLCYGGPPWGLGGFGGQGMGMVLRQGTENGFGPNAPGGGSEAGGGGHASKQTLPLHPHAAPATLPRPARRGWRGHVERRQAHDPHRPQQRPRAARADDAARARRA
jgi:hypothetical protein